MKNIHYMTIFFTMSSLTTFINAWEFNFYNNTNNPIGIAIQYTSPDQNPNEPLYPQLVKPNANIPFTPGKMKIPDIKWGFCLDNIYYIKNPTTEQKAHNFEKAPWRKIPITWVEQKSATKKAEKKEPSKKQQATPAAPLMQKSLCKDRHFDIIEDEHGKISVTASLNE